MTLLPTATCLLLFLHHFSLGFEVIQPGHLSVHSDRTVSISCQHTESKASTIIDVRLNRYTDDYTPEKKVVACQVGDCCSQPTCQNISWLKESANKYTFTLYNVQQRDTVELYECEFTKEEDDVYETKRGSPAVKVQTVPWGANNLVVPTCPPSSPPTCSNLTPLSYLLIGLLTLLLLYCSLITAFYFKLWCNKPETNPTYVDMRKPMVQARTQA